MNFVPDLLAARATIARLTADATVLGLIPAGGGYIRIYPDIAPAGAISPFLTYSIGGVAKIATPTNQPPAMITIPFDITAWKQYLAKAPLDPLVLAYQAALCGPDLRGLSAIVEGCGLAWYYAGPIPVRAETGDAGEWTRTATRFFIEIARVA